TEIIATGRSSNANAWRRHWQAKPCRLPTRTSRTAFRSRANAGISPTFVCGRSCLPCKTGLGMTHDEFALALQSLKPSKIGVYQMAYSNRRPESPKGKIFEAFKAKGAEAARKLAEKLDVAVHRVNRWIANKGSGFAKSAEQGRVEEKPKPKKPKAKKAA